MFRYSNLEIKSVKTEEVLHRLLYLAFVEIRAEAHEIGNGKVFSIADLLHTIPLQLERVNNGEEDIDNILAFLKEKAFTKGITNWLEIRLKEAEEK